METRRNFLKLAAMLSGAAGVSELIPEAVQRAYAIEPPPGSSYLDAEHIVILMQENRSFDHALGTLQGVRGFNDPRAIRLAGGNSVFVQTDAAGNSYAPWRLDIRDTRITWMGSIPHSRNSQVDAWNDGHHDGWLEAKRSHVAGYGELPLTMGHYTREDLPFYYALADAFTVCDQNYCSVMTSTTPNRSYFWTGTVRDKQRADSRVFMRNDQYARGGLPWKTYPERLQRAGITWKYYQNELTHSSGLNKDEHAWLSNFGCNIFENFSAYNIEAYPESVDGLKARLELLEKQVPELEEKLKGESDPDAVAHLRVLLALDREQIERLKAACRNCGEARYKQLSDRERALHDACFSVNSGDPNYHALQELTFDDQGRQQKMLVPKGDVLYQFRKDVNEGKLPAISWLTAPEKFSDHPTSPWYGAWYVSEVMDVLTKNPEVWKKTIFILTYDENDGYFDHAPSFVAPDPKRPETGRASSGIDTSLEYTYAGDELRQGVIKKEARSGPIGMGFRVPMIVASPWSRGGHVNSQLFDHTSTLQFLEHFAEHKFHKTVKEENISAWRRAITGDLSSVFRPYDPKEGGLEFLDRDKFVVGIEQARNKEVPSNFRKLTAEQIAEINKDLHGSELTSHQEPGVRPSCALPYELYADGGLSADRSKFTLTMKAGNAVHAKRSIGAPFNVYLRNGKTMRAATFTVSAGDALHEEFPLSLFADGKYSIDVHGPNGFYRSFTGDAATPGVKVSAAYQLKGASLTGNVWVNLANADANTVTVMVADNSYGAATVAKTLAPGQKRSVLLDLHRSHGWYDFTVKAEGVESAAHFAGRVETGRSSFTDPLMGRVKFA
jgi:phospholipase C